MREAMDEMLLNHPFDDDADEDGEAEEVIAIVD